MEVFLYFFSCGKKSDCAHKEAVLPVSQTGYSAEFKDRAVRFSFMLCLEKMW